MGIWLVFGAFLEMLIGGSTLFGHSLPISTDVVRHTYLLGFITNLILGMSVRMVPGFMRKRQVASAKLVDATFWLGNIAAFPFISSTPRCRLESGDKAVS